MTDYPAWIDYLEHFLEINPEAKSAELFRRFPELKNDQKILDAACGHIMGRRDEVSQASLRILFPEIYRPKMNWWQKFKKWLLERGYK